MASNKEALAGLKYFYLYLFSPFCIGYTLNGLVGLL